MLSIPRNWSQSKLLHLESLHGEALLFVKGDLDVIRVD